MISKYSISFLLVAVFIASMVFAINNTHPLTDSEIKNLIIKESISKYHGNCPCPYNRASNGTRCGKRSAYSKSGGYSTMCYESDITEEIINNYKAKIAINTMAKDISTDGENITQNDMNIDAYNEFKKSDNELNYVYQEIHRIYIKNPVFLEKLRISQKAWIIFRDAEVEANFPLKSNQEGRAVYGSVYPMCKSNVLAILTEERIKQLRSWLNINEDGGDICSGSLGNTNSIDERY